MTEEERKKYIEIDRSRRSVFFGGIVKLCTNCTHGTKLFDNNYCNIVGNTPANFGCHTHWEVKNEI